MPVSLDVPRASTLTELWMQLCKEHKALAEQGIHEVREQLKAKCTETRTFNLPDGPRTFSAMKGEEDGAWANKRNARAGCHTIYVFVDGTWVPIACYFCQSACATCEHAVQRFVRDATDEEIQNLSASSTTMFRLISRLKQKGCTLLSDKIDSVGNILEEDCEEDWEALTPEDWLGFMEVIRGIVGEHDCPINATPRPWRVAQQDTTSSLC